MASGFKVTRGVCAILMIAALVDVKAVQAQSAKAQEYKVKAAFLYKFCHYAEWPDTAFDTPDSPLVMGVAGPQEFINELKKVVQGRDINGRPTRVRHVDHTTVIQNLHLLFVARSEERYMSHLLSLADGKPILVVTESSFGLNAGSVINFVMEENKVRFDISQMAAKKQGLKLSAQLLKVAREVEKEGP